MIIKTFKTLTAGLLLAGVAACGAVTSNSKAVFMLVDASGTYVREVPDAVVTAKLLTSKLNSNDMFAFGEIGSCSFSDSSLVVRRTLPGTPSEAAYAKQAVFENLEAYAETVQPTGWTDIRGGLRYAAAELEQSDQASRYIVLVSDLVEDVSPDCDTRNLELDLEGITVIVTNVTRSDRDASDPNAYFERLEAWEALVEDAGGTWVHANSRDRLLEYMF